MSLFRVQVRYVGKKQVIQPQDHNNCVDALKEIVDVAMRIVEQLQTVVR